MSAPEYGRGTPADFEEIFENAPCGYLSTGTDGRVFRANTTLANWLGRAREELVGERFQDLLTIASKIYYDTHLAPLLRMQGAFHEVALDLVRRDGPPLPTLVNAVERRDVDGTALFVRMTIFNATDRRAYERELLSARNEAQQASAKLAELNATLERRVAEAVRERLRAEDALRQAQKMEAIGQLAGGIAHDFNNMLAVVISGLSLLERRLEKGEYDVGKYVSAAKEAANRAVVLTRRLLAFSRRQSLSPDVLDANRIVVQMCDIVRQALGESIHLETALVPAPWKIHADANQLENALLNLALNARDAMPDGGRLLIETANCHFDDAHARLLDLVAGDYVTVAVTDTGVGMTPEVAERAFEPFFSTKPAHRGTGLGLSQVFGFVKQSGGQIKIDSEAGRGTSVKIYLPRFHDAANEMASAADRRDVEAPGRNPV